MSKRGTAEFNRVTAFSDGIFAIAMTLLIVSVAVPTISDTDSVSDLADALNDQVESFTSFFISFAVIGRYWVAHHQFFSLLDRFDGRLIAINLVYLAFIAFVPFPTDLMGTYFSNPLSISIYAVTIAIISGLEVVMLRHAHVAGLMHTRMPGPVYRWAVIQSTAPVVFFVLSVPVAFVAGSTLAVLCWFAVIPYAIATRNGKPADFDSYFDEQA